MSSLFRPFVYADGHDFVARTAPGRRRRDRSLLTIRRLGIALCMMPVLSCSPRERRAPAGTGLTSGNHQFSFRHGGRMRSYIVHVPPGLGPPGAASAPLPVLLAFHGGGGNASGFQQYAELDRVADRERFLVVYPNGTGPLPNRLLTWNAGDGCCGYALTNNVNDAGFAASVVGDVERRIRIDQTRIYATGHSNGGIFAHRLAAERSGIIAAIASVAGSLDLRTFAPTRAVPVMQIHSVDDPRALYAGGLGPPFPGTDNRVFHQPVQTGLDRWITANGCSARADTAAVKLGTGQSATLLVFKGCRGGGEVAHWKLTGSGHGWPGDVAPPGGEGLAGPQTRLIRAADEVWSFVSRFRTP